MKPIHERIRRIQDTEIKWDWETNTPYYLSKDESEWGITTKFDPFPCYAHDKNLVLSCVEECERKFTIGFNTFYYIFPLESISRTNGQAHTNNITYADKSAGTKAVWEGIVQLSGKRIPIHPAMTRYLVAHEYGHIVDSWICHQKGLGANGMDADYAKMRGLENNQNYGGRNWHTNIGEIIANDFRVIVCGVETEFWPHKCKHPNDVTEVKDFWLEMFGNHAVI